MSVLWFRGLFTEEVAELECNNRYKSNATQAEPLFLSRAFESFALKDGNSLPLNLDHARSSQLTQRGSHGFPMKSELAGQIRMGHARNDAVLGRLYQQSCKLRDQAFADNDLHLTENVRASFAHEVDEFVGRMRSTFEKGFDTASRNQSNARITHGFGRGILFSRAEAAQFAEYPGPIYLCDG
jgi:hypothetical protein